MHSPKPLRLVVIAHDNEGSVEIVRTLAQAFPSQIVGVCITTGIYYRRTRAASIMKLLRECSWMFATHRFLDLVIYRVRGGTTLKSLCKQFHIPFFHSRNVNNIQSVEKIKAMKPNVVMSAFTMHIVGQDLIGLPGVSVFGVHPSLIPDYRGLEVFFWMLANGETQSGSSAFLLTKQIDRGRVICTDHWLIEPHDSVVRVYAKLTRSCADLAVKATKILIDSNPAHGAGGSETSREGSYFPMPTRKAYRDFRMSGRRWR